jgi:hypothetical protein
VAAKQQLVKARAIALDVAPPHAGAGGRTCGSLGRRSPYSAYKADPHGRLRYGLIAAEVAKVFAYEITHESTAIRRTPFVLPPPLSPDPRSTAQMPWPTILSAQRRLQYLSRESVCDSYPLCPNFPRLHACASRIQQQELRANCDAIAAVATRL